MHALEDTLKLLEQVVDLAESVIELRSPTWKLLFREADRLFFYNSAGQTAWMPTGLAVPLARGINVAIKGTRIERDKVVFELGDGTCLRIPKSLLAALAPRRWSGGSRQSEGEV